MTNIGTIQICGQSKTAANKGLAKVAVQYLIEIFCFVSSFG